MTKLIGTGKDPRAPKGVDYDIPDVREAEVEAHVEGGIGEVVHLPEEMDRIHAGQKIIEAEGGVPGEGLDEGAAATARGEHEDNTAARIESTSPQGGSAGSGSDSPGEGLSGLTRDELDARAREAGVAEPESLPNKDAVEGAIREAEAS